MPEPTRTLVATLHPPLDPAMLVACLTAGGVPQTMMPWKVPLEILIATDAKGLCLRIYRLEPATDVDLVGDLQARVQALQAQQQIPPTPYEAVPYNEAISEESLANPNAAYPGARA
jgi:hypothetical protein